MRVAVFLPVLLVAVPLLSGCGRKATREDCVLLVDRNVEVKLQSEGTNDPAVIQKRKEEMRTSEQPKIDECVGKRVRDNMMTCVKSAQTADEIDKCLR